MFFRNFEEVGNILDILSNDETQAVLLRLFAVVSSFKVSVNLFQSSCFEFNLKFFKKYHLQLFLASWDYFHYLGPLAMGLSPNSIFSRKASW